MIKVNDIVKIYKNGNMELKVLKGLNLEVKEGEYVAFMGPSGSGKTTMMNIIGCMDKASIGEVILDDTNISKLSPKELTEIRRDKIGLIFQQFHLVNYLTAVENIMMAQYYHSMPDEEEAMAALEAVGLADRAKHLPNQLSGGEQQRVCIARALTIEPKVLLLDEPCSALDIENTLLIEKLLTELKSGISIIIVTHNIEQAKRIGDEIVTMKSGNLSEGISL